MNLLITFSNGSTHIYGVKCKVQQDRAEWMFQNQSYAGEAAKVEWTKLKKAPKKRDLDLSEHDGGILAD